MSGPAISGARSLVTRSSESFSLRPTRVHGVGEAGVGGHPQLGRRLLPLGSLRSQASFESQPPSGRAARPFQGSTVCPHSTHAHSAEAEVASARRQRRTSRTQGALEIMALASLHLIFGVHVF